MSHTIAAKITDAKQVADEIWRLFIKPKSVCFPYQAGQYSLLSLPGFEAQAYSIANAPCKDSSQVELHVRHHTDTAFTTAILSAAKSGQEINLSGPFGQAIYQDKSTDPIIIVVGGTGFAQGKALLEAHLAANPTIAAHLFWVARSPEELYLKDLLEKWQQEYAAFHFTPIVSRPEGSGWQGHSERIYHVVTHYYPDLSQSLIYASGPQSLVVDALHTFMAHGMPKARMIADAL